MGQTMFVLQIYEKLRNWQGEVLLFYGARTGLESVYMNNRQNDFTNYYDEKTFKAFNAVSPRPHWGEPVAMEELLQEQHNEILKLLEMENTYFFIAGYSDIEAMLEKAFTQIVGSAEDWKNLKQE